MFSQNQVKLSRGFFFEFVYLVDYIDGFPYIEPSLHLWDEAYLMVEDNHFAMFLDSARFFEYFFASIFKRKTGLMFSFFVGYFCGLGFRVIVA